MQPKISDVYATLCSHIEHELDRNGFGRGRFGRETREKRLAIRKEFGTVIRQRRQELKKSQRWLEIETGLTENRIYIYEKGQIPNHQTGQRIIEALQFPHRTFGEFMRYVESRVQKASDHSLLQFPLHDTANKTPHAAQKARTPSPPHGKNQYRLFVVAMTRLYEEAAERQRFDDAKFYDVKMMAKTVYMDGKVHTLRELADYAVKFCETLPENHPLFQKFPITETRANHQFLEKAAEQGRYFW